MPSVNLPHDTYQVLALRLCVSAVIPFLTPRTSRLYKLQRKNIGWTLRLGVSAVILFFAPHVSRLYKLDRTSIGWALRLGVSAVILFFAPQVQTQTATTQTGVLEVNGRVKIDGKQERLKRKRFYLFRGGLTANKALVDRIRAAEFVSRDCFYCRMNASPEFRAWLKEEDCESPFCREITSEDAARVPEFKAAMQKGTQQFARKPGLALEWLTTNLAPGLRDGFYLQRKRSIDGVLGDARPLMNGMTDSVSVKAIFIDIPVAAAAGKSTETFLISNIAPFEIGAKSYVWACEVEIGADKKAVRSLPVPEPGKRADKCEVFIRDLPACDGQVCAAR